MTRHLTLRTRMVALAVAVVTVILVIGGLVITAGLQRALTAGAVEAATLRATELAALAERGALPDPVPIADEDEALVQVALGDRVVASSANIDGEPPLNLASPPPGETQMVAASTLPIEDAGEFRVVASGARLQTGRAVVYVAVSLEEIAETVAEIQRLGLLGLPVLVLLLSAAMWLVVGRTLQPVDAIATEAAAITSTGLDRRVPEPSREDEIGRLARTVNGMLAGLEESWSRQRRFVADAAHELRSPIASQRAQLETALDAQGTVDWQQVSGDLLDETLRMQTLTEQLLLLARVDAGELELHRVAVDLDDLVDLQVRAVREIAPGITFGIAGVTPVQVLGAPVLIGQVVANLLDNAARHARSHVDVATRRDGGTAELIVDDDGEGVPPEARASVFERFTRLDEARDRDSGGAGLGLAIVADIVTAHGGTVHVERSPAGGARFVVGIPTTLHG